MEAYHSILAGLYLLPEGKEKEPEYAILYMSRGGGGGGGSVVSGQVIKDVAFWIVTQSSTKLLREKTQGHLN